MEAKRSDVSPQAPRIPKPQDLYSRYQLPRPSREEEKRVEHNYFMRRVLTKQRGHKNSDLQDLPLSVQDESKDSTDLFPPKNDDKKRPARTNQPRQKPQEKKEAINLANLSNIVLEMKEMLNNMPNVQEVINKSHEQTKKNSTVTPKNRSREISLHDKSARKSMKLKNYILNSKPSRRLMSSKPSSRPTTTHKYSKPLPVIKSKPTDDLSQIQNYFLDFHAKSKFLLKNLERSVLGENKIL